MSGNISKTYIKKIKGEEFFIKEIDIRSFNNPSLHFQNMLRGCITGKFNVNKFHEVNINSSKKGSHIGRLRFDKIDEKPWAVDKESMRIIGTSMAIIHNYSYNNSHRVTLNKKQEEYNSMEGWDNISHEIPGVTDAHVMRLNIFNQIDRLNVSQPKIPLHRDFKPHNILWDGNSYHLIDFDFAAIDYVSLEVMGFVVDILDHSYDAVKQFIKSYLGTIKIPIKPEYFVDDYLNYLCVNTFPFYLNNLPEENFKNLVEHRNKSLNDLFKHRQKIKRIIDESI